MEGVQHALCNAHHLRELQALIVIEKEPWANNMKTLLLEAKTRADILTAIHRLRAPPSCA
jgi:transposase